MKPAPLDYYDPSTVEEALELLQKYGDDAKVLAGGQSLMPLLNMRLVTPRVIVDVNRIASLAYVREGEDGGLRIGALTRQAAVERSELVAQKLPLLAEAVRLIGHVQIRHRGTIGGSIAHADPAAELPGVLTALNGQVVVRGPQGTRLVPASEFFVNVLTTVLAPTELVVEVRLPPIPKGAGWAFVEITRRHGDFALAGVAAVLALGSGGTIETARLGAIGVGPTPVKPARAEAMLVGERPCESLFRSAAEAVSEGLVPLSDVHASAEYRRELAAVMARRALDTALRRARPV